MTADFVAGSLAVLFVGFFFLGVFALAAYDVYLVIAGIGQRFAYRRGRKIDASASRRPFGRR